MMFTVTLSLYRRSLSYADNHSAFFVGAHLAGNHIKWQLWLPDGEGEHIHQKSNRVK